MAYSDVLERRLIDGRQQSVNVLSNTPDIRTGAAQLLAYLAAAPLIVASLVIVAQSGPIRELAVEAMGVYGGALIVFFGGVRWGVAILKEGGPTMRALIGAALPLVLALPFFAPVDAAFKFPAIMAVIALLLIDDMKATARGSGAPAWYLAARLPLTVLIELSYVIALVGMAR